MAGHNQHELGRLGGAEVLRNSGPHSCAPVLGSSMEHLVPGALQLNHKFGNKAGATRSRFWWSRVKKQPT